MASLKSVIDELDIINEKIERLGVLLAKAREDIDYVQTRAAELQRAPVLPDMKAPHVHYPSHSGTMTGGYICGGCGQWVALSKSSDGG